MAFHGRRSSIKDGGTAKFPNSNKMPKRLVSEGWVKKPCLYRLPAGAARVCTWCQEPFSFWNGRHHCAFCGYVFHRSECTRKCSIEGEFFKRRICVYCDQYRAYEAKLRTGDKFVCYSVRRGKPEKVVISLSEATAELVFHWTAHGLLETVDLLNVEVQKGFSHAGRMRTADYEPLKCFSLLLKDEDKVKTIELKAAHAWTCQLWVDGLSAAKYIYRRMLEQEETFFRSLLVTHKPREPSPVTDSDSMCTNISYSESSPGRGAEGLHEDICCSPSSLSRQRELEKKRHHTIHTSRPLPAPCKDSSNVLVQDYPHSWQSTPGLPYQSSPLSSICSCHAYEIMPPRTVDLREPEMGRTPVNVGQKRCCPNCEVSCRIALDLENL